jgi:hypothetical protein
MNQTTQDKTATVQSQKFSSKSYGDSFNFTDIVEIEPDDEETKPLK